MQTEAVKEILSERGRTHGNFEENATFIQSIKDIVRQGKNWDNLTLMERESIDMIITKISRAVCGKSIKDHYDDMAGYALLGGSYADPGPEIPSQKELEILRETERQFEKFMSGSYHITSPSGMLPCHARVDKTVIRCACASCVRG